MGIDNNTLKRMLVAQKGIPKTDKRIIANSNVPHRKGNNLQGGKNLQRVGKFSAKFISDRVLLSKVHEELVTHPSPKSFNQRMG